MTNESKIDLLYHQFYVGMDRNLTHEEREFILQTATSEVNLDTFFEALHSSKYGRKIPPLIER